MRNLHDLDVHRCYDPWVMKTYGSYGDAQNGVFRVPHASTGVTLSVIAASGDSWDHVSVSLDKRTPNWYEMQYIHRMFFKANEMVWQYHMPLDKHISRTLGSIEAGKNVLHLWRKHNFEMPTPPTEFV